jgi:hypothetical protein
MTKSEIQVIQRAISALSSLINRPQEGSPLPRPSPARQFVRDYLVADAKLDLSCNELWRFFQEVVAAGELSPMRKAVFLRQLPGLMQEVFQLRKCHRIQRESHHVRGFKGVSVRMDC